MHRNAPLTPEGRFRLCRLIEDGWSVAGAAECMRISRQTAHKWWWRYQEAGRPGLVDRSSRPWVVSETEPARPDRDPVFQYDVIVGMMDLIAKGEKAWLDLYEKLGVEPLEVVYEDFSTPDGYELTVRRVLQHLDLDDTIEISRQRTDQQTDSINDEWVDRFLHQDRDRCFEETT